ncbi:YgzB family protein [Camelliibacillus cellulosilyticus]|uniref:YgzB family protein n=1 Tax=Camelliibacillus cellulosilyticus TaxID=2174486 RepID=A0ABV9GM60_9BACL
MFFKKTSKVNKFRNFALLLVFLGIIIMYIALVFRAHPIIMTILMVMGFLAVLLSSFVYLWVGMLSLKVVQVSCPNCGKRTKILGRVDLCMHCNEPLTLDPDLDGKPFDKKYNRKSYQSGKPIDPSHK